MLWFPQWNNGIGSLEEDDMLLNDLARLRSDLTNRK